MIINFKTKIFEKLYNKRIIKFNIIILYINKQKINNIN